MRAACARAATPAQRHGRGRACARVGERARARALDEQSPQQMYLCLVLCLDFLGMIIGEARCCSVTNVVGGGPDFVWTDVTCSRRSRRHGCSHKGGAHGRARTSSAHHVHAKNRLLRQAVKNRCRCSPQRVVSGRRDRTQNIPWPPSFAVDGRKPHFPSRPGRYLSAERLFSTRSGHCPSSAAVVELFSHPGSGILSARSLGL